MESFLIHSLSHLLSLAQVAHLGRHTRELIHIPWLLLVFIGGTTFLLLLLSHHKLSLSFSSCSDPSLTLHLSMGSSSCYSSRLHVSHLTCFFLSDFVTHQVISKFLSWTAEQLAFLTGVALLHTWPGITLILRRLLILSSCSIATLADLHVVLFELKNDALSTVGAVNFFKVIIKLEVLGVH